MIEVICNINKYGYKLIMSNINFNKNNTICLIETFSIKKKKKKLSKIRVFHNSTSQCYVKTIYNCEFGDDSYLIWEWLELNTT